MSVEICPACKDGLICFPEKVAASLGNIDPLVLCTQVSNSLLLLDPQTLRTAYTDANQYWRTGFSLGFRPLLHARQLVEYTILDIEIDPSASTRAGKYVLADVQVARKSDSGKYNITFERRRLCLGVAMFIQLIPMIQN